MNEPALLSLHAPPAVTPDRYLYPGPAALFVHTILLDSDSDTAMTLGQTYLTTTDTPRPLSRYGLDFIEA